MGEESIIEDQLNEMEVLQSMYFDEIEGLFKSTIRLVRVLSESPHTFNILIFANIDEEADTNKASVTIQFKFTKTYPHEAPIFELVSCEDLDRNAEIDIMNLIEKLCTENIGEAMIFNFITAIQDKIIEILDLLDNDRKMEVLRLEKKIFDEEQKKFEGQIVTIESFLEWKTAFNAEMELKQKKTQFKNKDINNKLTGKELFNNDLTMDDSDVKFLENEGQIEIDEALFDDGDEDNEDDEDGINSS